MTHALIILANGFEDLEAITITDLLVRAGIKITRAGLVDGPIAGSRYTRVIPDVSLDEVIDQKFDLIVLPGGQPGSNNLAADERVLTLIKKQAFEKRLLGAICAAPRVFVKAGLADNKSITCYPDVLTDMDTQSIEITRDAVCVDLPLITSRGPGTAIDFSLELIEQLTDKTTRDKVNASLVRQ